AHLGHEPGEIAAAHVGRVRDDEIEGGIEPRPGLWIAEVRFEHGEPVRDPAPLRISASERERLRGAIGSDPGPGRESLEQRDRDRSGPGSPVEEGAWAIAFRAARFPERAPNRLDQSLRLGPWDQNAGLDANRCAQKRDVTQDELNRLAAFAACDGPL